MGFSFADLMAQQAPQQGPQPGQGMIPPQQGATTAPEGGQQVAGAWGVDAYNDGYVIGKRVGDTVFVENANSMSHPVGHMVMLAQKLSPGLKFILPGNK